MTSISPLPEASSDIVGGCSRVSGVCGHNWGSEVTELAAHSLDRTFLISPRLKLFRSRSSTSYSLSGSGESTLYSCFLLKDSPLCQISI